MDSEDRDIIFVAHRHGKRRADEGLAAYVEVERAQLRTVPPLLCRARGIEKRRLDIVIAVLSLLFVIVCASLIVMVLVLEADVRAVRIQKRGFTMEPAVGF